MHLSRFITIDIWAMTLISSRFPFARSSLRAPPSVLDLLAPTADDRDLVPLVPGGSGVVEGVGQLRIAADEVAGLHKHPGERVVDPAALPGRLGHRHVHHP